ncbi:MAG: hypothetical protein Q4A66_08875, partial [Eubacteriales bacterium]|nr:hypothetical protein [Eubacteriales bacterium]
MKKFRKLLSLALVLALLLPVYALSAEPTYAYGNFYIALEEIEPSQRAQAEALYALLTEPQAVHVSGEAGKSVWQAAGLEEELQENVQQALENLCALKEPKEERAVALMEAALTGEASKTASVTGQWNAILSGEEPAVFLPFYAPLDEESIALGFADEDGVHAIIVNKTTGTLHQLSLTHEGALSMSDSPLVIMTNAHIELAAFAVGQGVLTYRMVDG